MNDKLLTLIRFYYAQSVFMTNVHYKASSRFIERKKKIKCFEDVLTILTVASLIVEIIALQNQCDILAKIVTVIALLLTATQLINSFIYKEDLTEKIIYHKIYAEKYKVLRDKYMSLIEKVMSNCDNETNLREINDSYIIEYDTIGELAPTTIYDDYKKSQIALGLGENKGEEFTWSNHQIDILLPEELRLNK